jgi:hypothetical protein
MAVMLYMAPKVVVGITRFLHSSLCDIHCRSCPALVDESRTDLHIFLPANISQSHSRTYVLLACVWSFPVYLSTTSHVVFWGGGRL